MAYSLLAQRVNADTKGSDTLSEVSEYDTGMSGWDSKDELNDFIARIGLKDISDLYQERIRVNRKKLEQMLLGDNEATLPADVFFEQIMSDTDTYITWPSKLKVGAKSKKDPHIRIAGRPENVQSAKERILNVLDIKYNRVTMKLDVSYTDHSHIIGKEGLNVKRVMEETQCHVHFPDSNRSSQLEKSNQVSISGDIEKVESARNRIRILMPLIFGFELPIMSKDVDVTSPYIEDIQEQYKVQVIFKTRPKLHASSVLVKGVEWEVERVKQATLLLMEFMCENLANQIPVYMAMEISPHYHPIVLGKNHSNLKAIMRHTNCQIMFCDTQDPNIPNLKRSNVSITGNIHGVYQARQLLIGSLPLMIMFDLPKDVSSIRTKPEQLAEIQSTCDLIINIRDKAKQSSKVCVIKGIEKYASNIYKARNLVLGIDQPHVIAIIPPSYQITSSSSCPTTEPNLLQVPSKTNIQPISPMLNPVDPHKSSYPLHSFNQSPPVLGMTQQSRFMCGLLHGSLSSSGYHSVGPFSGNSIFLDQNNRENSNTYSSVASTISSPSPVVSPRNVSPKFYTHFEFPTQKLDVSPILSDVSSSTGSATPDGRQYALPSGYEQKRMAGIRAMQIRPTGNYRIPNNSWSGYGISHTSPSFSCVTPRQNKVEDIWKPTTANENTKNSPLLNMNTSNYLDHTPQYITNRILTSQWSDLSSMLRSLGLEKYISIFNSNEIDLVTFSSLTDQDLLNIGIKAFGARRKMLLTISELNKRNRHFPLAPGAERKTSSASSNGSNF